MLRVIFKKILYFISYTVPFVIVFASLLVLLARSYALVLNGDLEKVLTPYLTAVALCLAFASAIFEYASFQTDGFKDEIINWGENFLYAATCLTIAMLSCWLIVYIENFAVSSIFKKVSEFPVKSSIFAIGVLPFLTYASISLSSTIRRIDEFFYKKLDII